MEKMEQCPNPSEGLQTAYSVKEAKRKTARKWRYILLCLKQNNYLEAEETAKDPCAFCSYVKNLELLTGWSSNGCFSCPALYLCADHLHPSSLNGLRSKTLYIHIMNRVKKIFAKGPDSSAFHRWNLFWLKRAIRKLIKLIEVL
jgi:hypothetical protein